MCTPRLLYVRVECKDIYNICTHKSFLIYILCIYIYLVYLHKLLCSSTVLSILGHVLCLVTVDSMLKVHSVHCDSLSVPLSLPMAHPESNTGQQNCSVDCCSWFKCSDHICLSKRIFACPVSR